MAKIKSAPSGEKTSIDWTEAFPIDGNQYMLTSRIKTYIDGIAVNLGKRQRVRAATTANITISTALNNADTLDGVTLATGDLVLVKNQSAPENNGVYVVGVSPARDAQFDTYDEHPGSLIAVEEGTANADTLWLCTSNAGGTLNTTAIAFSQFVATGGGVATDTIFDAKGDLPIGTGSDTAAKLSVGSNGQVFTADPTQTTGVKWATPSGGGSGGGGAGGLFFTNHRVGEI